LTPEVFRDGIRRYMKAHSYSNATEGDLWFHLSQAAGRDVTATIGTWINQPGTPLVTVKTRCERGRLHVDLAQRRFAAIGASLPNATWEIPMVLRAGTTTRQILLGAAPQRVDFPRCAPVIANGDDIGYYRVHYDAAENARVRKAYASFPPME